MANFNLGKQFDVVTCLFSSIGYLKTKKELNAAISNIAQHTKPGGVVLIEPWLTKEGYKPGSPHLNTYQTDDLKIARVTVSSKKGNLSVMDMHYLIAERNKTVKHFVDRHELAMFPTADILNMMKKAGLKASYLKSGFMKDRGLLLGIK